ncbi:MAG TPA: MFS transporter [Actinophytocola sp.]|uniref:MFS transporter n=1 Tax=Actinophytocola sp. TaxID=1872138 RepID=UPI002DDCC931|nr:MFS transporter [Actinophytocola sp.]HEV2779812.1 MFS transporter [Actinophytocola sp.]
MNDFGKLWTAGTISSLGDGVTVVAGPLLAAALTRDPVQVAGLMVAEQLPMVVFTLPGGAIVDRVDRRLLMSAASVVRFACLGALALLVATGQASLPVLYAIFLVIGCAAVLYENASMTAVPAVVGPDELERANGRILASRTLCNSLLAPVAAGWLFTMSPWTPFAVDAVAFAVVAVLARALSRSVGRVFRDSGVTLRAAIAEGVRWLLRHRLLRTLAVTVALSNVTLGAMMSIMVLVAQERLGLGSVGYGILLAGTAVGGIIGGLIAPRVVRRLGPGTVFRLDLVVEALTQLGLALTRDAVAAGMIIATLGLHLIVFSTVSASLRATLTPSGLLGRVHSAYRLLSNGGLLLGAALGGVLGRYFGLTAPFWVGAVLVSAVTLWAWRVLNNRDIHAARAAARSAVGCEPGTTDHRTHD